MNKILVEVSVGELLDKISILEIKQEKIKDNEGKSMLEKYYGNQEKYAFAFVDLLDPSIINIFFSE